MQGIHIDFIPTRRSYSRKIDMDIDSTDCSSSESVYFDPNFEFANCEKVAAMELRQDIEEMKQAFPEKKVVDSFTVLSPIKDEEDDFDCICTYTTLFTY